MTPLKREVIPTPSVLSASLRPTGLLAFPLEPFRGWGGVICQISFLFSHPLPPHHPSAACGCHWLSIQLAHDQIIRLSGVQNNIFQMVCQLCGSGVKGVRRRRPAGVWGEGLPWEPQEPRRVLSGRRVGWLMGKEEGGMGG